jgi:5'(3')-deoxyribonucleotidase
MKKSPTLLDLYEAIKPKYIIFCDMDGVLVDFDKGYKELTGKHTKHVDLQDKNEFWGLLDRSLKDKGLTEYDYWVNLEWMPDGQTLWNYIKGYNPYILTAPSRDPGSRQGKTEWATRLDGMKKLYFKPAKFKSEYSDKNRILIDDRQDTIDSWNAAGGIGILHTSTANTIQQLEKLGL